MFDTKVANGNNGIIDEKILLIKYLNKLPIPPPKKTKNTSGNFY